MKKILAIFLALVTIMSVALVACDKNNGGTTGGNSNDDDDDDIFVTQGNNKDTDTGAKDSDTKDTSDDWVALTNTTIYTMCGFFLRKEDSMNATKVKEVSAQTALNAIAKNDEWYKVSYEGQELYISSDYVASSLEAATFTDLAEADRFTITLQEAQNTKNPTVNIRSIPTFDKKWGSYKDQDHTKCVQTLTIASTTASPLTVIAKNGTGDWYKVTYQGGTWYLPVTSQTRAYLKGLPTSPSSGEIFA